ncbi:MAG: acyl carrier protein [Actinobacteria bacterium]|nr:acyl carrier protein [Actinomycetota bacterium]
MSSAVYDKVKELLIEKFGVAEDEISPEATFSDLDLDSLDLVEFALAAEEEMGVRISDEEAEQLDTLNDTVKLLEQKGATVEGEASHQ